MSDIPTGLTFVDPSETLTTYRVGLFAAPGAGKSVAAASAPTPILLLSADRPAAYAFARKLHNLDGQALREVRYVGLDTLADVYRYLDSEAGHEIKTVIVDPIGNIYDSLREVAPKDKDGDTDYSWVNSKLFGFVKSLRRFDVHVVLVAHEKLNDGKKGDGKLYPHFGGQGLINKIMGELDICAHIQRVLREVEGQDEPEQTWIGQLQPRDKLVCKEATGGSLGERRIANLSRWFEVAGENLTLDVAKAESDLPFSEHFDPSAEPEAADHKSRRAREEAEAIA